MTEDRSKLLTRLLPVLVIIVAVALFWAWRRMSATHEAPEPSTRVAAAQPAPDLPPGSAFAPLELQWVETTGQPPEWPDDFGRPANCSAALDRLRALTSRIDAGDYARESGVSASTFELLLDASDALGRRRPAIGIRLDDGGAMRANVAYFLLTLGPDRLGKILQLGSNAPQAAEPLALDLYQWLRSGDRCPEGNRPPPADLQYDYAAFLLQTIGGQAYLRRRAPRIEALASFYALLIADQSIAAGHNPHGLDLRRELARTRALIEGQPLVFRNQYLRILGELDTRWQKLTGGSR